MTKAQAQIAVRAIIDRYSLGIRFSVADTQALSELCGVELRQVVRRKNPQYPTDQRHLHASLGESSEPREWSWRNALDEHHARDKQRAKAMRPHTKVLWALRRAIEPDMREFAFSQKDQRCAECGSTENLTVDHADVPFHAIACDFLAHLPQQPELRSLTGGGDALADRRLRSEWITFHTSRTPRYQFLCRACNSSKGCRTGGESQ